MAFSKIILNNNTLVDMTDATATSDKIQLGQTAYGADGTKITGIKVLSYTIDEIAQHDYAVGNIVTNATALQPYMFARTPIISFTGNNVTAFTGYGGGNGSYVFENCTNLEQVHLPELVNIGSGGYQFSGCTKLVTINLPKTLTGQYMFQNCTSLVSVVLGGTGQLNGNGFRGCTSLKYLDIAASRIYTNEFYDASSLDTLIIRRTTIPTLSNINAFTNTPFASGGTGGTIYIPKSLYDHLGDNSSSDYKKATNWTTLNGYGTVTWAKIEDSYYQTHYADGTEIPTS